MYHNLKLTLCPHCKAAGTLILNGKLLRSLRNDLPMAIVIQQLGDDSPHSKYVEGRLRFVCHHCRELRAAVNPRNNLAHCFSCGKNINNIDLLLAAEYGFIEAVQKLEGWLLLYKRNGAGSTPAGTPRQTVSESTPAIAADIGVLSQTLIVFFQPVYRTSDPKFRFLLQR